MRFISLSSTENSRLCHFICLALKLLLAARAIKIEKLRLRASRPQIVPLLRAAHLSLAWPWLRSILDFLSGHLRQVLVPNLIVLHGAGEGSAMGVPTMMLTLMVGLLISDEGLIVSSCRRHVASFGVGCLGHVGRCDPTVLDCL